MDIAEMELERVKGLAHGNIHVRSEMLSSFSRDSPVSSEVTGIAISQVERYGWEGSFVFPQTIAKLPHTPDSPDWALDAVLSGKLRQEDHDRTPPEAHLLEWLAKAPVESLERIRPQLSGSAKTSGSSVLSRRGEDFQLVAERRIAARVLGADELRSAITAAVEACADEDEFPRKQIFDLEALCEVAGANGVFTDEDLARWLDAPFAEDVDDFDYVPGYSACAALLVFSERRQPVPPEITGRIVRLFDIDWDWTNELIAKTLEKTADREMLADLIHRYPDLEWHARLFLSGALESLRIAGFEDDFQRLYRDEKDLTLKNTFARTLALHGTETALYTARQHLRKHGDHNESQSLRNLVFCQEIILGRESSAASAHLVRMEADRKRMLGTIAQLTAEMDDYSPAPTLLDELMAGEERRIPERLPAQVGRNEPCPCGSGKKYKKCCGK